MKLKYLFVSLSVFFLIKVSAQTATVPGTVPNIMSPDVASLGKYGTYNINYYTGVPDITIPLYDIKENGVNIPIALSYDASGFIPNKNAGMVGLNWNLVAGGAITRVVNGVPDDKYNPNHEYNNINIGYIYGQQHGYGTYSSDYIQNVQYLTNFTSPYNLAYEYIPDIFSFNFLGHSGRFFMDNNGQVQVIGDRNYKVDLSNLTGQYDFLAPIQQNTIFSQIVMTSDDGFQFYFGGSLKALEISFSLDQNSSYPNAPGEWPNRYSGQINAWYLTKVITPDGNQILFNYQDYSTNDLAYLQNFFTHQDGAWSGYNISFLELKLFQNQQLQEGTAGGNNFIWTDTRPVIYGSLVKTAYLSQIQTNAQAINFYYDEKDLTNKFYTQSGTDLSAVGTSLTSIIRNRYTKRLSYLTVTDLFPESDYSDLPYSRRVDFGYTWYSNRMFLTSLNINSNTEKYAFTYYNTGSLPDPLTKGVDMWGFYNGHNDNSALFLLPNQNNSEYTVDPSASGANRLAVWPYSSYGLLNTITYPTGGTTQFVYEANTYGAALTRKVSSGITPVWDATSGTAGGARIQQIINTPGVTTTFKYVTGYESNHNTTASSGLLLQNGIYYLDFATTSGATSGYIAALSDNNIAAAAGYNEPHIAYSEVVELNNDGYTQYKFTNPQSNPDVYYLGSGSYKITSEISTTNFNNQMERLYHYSGTSDERGKLYRKEVWDANNLLKQTIDYTYNTDPNRFNSSTIASYCPVSVNWYGTPAALVQSYALYYYQNNLTQTTEKDYAPDGSHYTTKTTSLKYRSNTSQLLDQKSIIRSNGDIITDEYKYPTDFSSQDPYTTMVNRNILTPVIQDLQYKNPATTNQFLQSSTTNYSFFQGNALIKPSSAVTQVGTFSNDTRMNFYGYDNAGNLLSYSKSNDVLHSYVWDYGQTLPVADVVNASTADIAYTSFEADNSTSWTIGSTSRQLVGLTGGKSYQLSNGAISKSGLTNGKKYIVSYWTQNASSFTVNGTAGAKGRTYNGWTYYEHVITLSGTTITIPSVTGTIDELRLYPYGAQMTTYTYQPSWGITSKCDANNRITYYEYDNVGRLKAIRDQDNHIIKQFDYQYQQPQ